MSFVSTTHQKTLDRALGRLTPVKLSSFVRLEMAKGLNLTDISYALEVPRRELSAYLEGRGVDSASIWESEVEQCAQRLQKRWNQHPDLSIDQVLEGEVVLRGVKSRLSSPKAKAERVDLEAELTSYVKSVSKALKRIAKDEQLTPSRYDETRSEGDPSSSEIISRIRWADILSQAGADESRFTRKGRPSIFSREDYDSAVKEFIKELESSGMKPTAQNYQSWSSKRNAKSRRVPTLAAVRNHYRPIGWSEIVSQAQSAL